MSESKTKAGLTEGMSFLSWLTLLFVALKLTGYIDWSWWWVWSPMLFQLGFIGVLLLIMGVIWLLVIRHDK